MARKKSRTILIILLVLSAILGLSAIGISYYYSHTDDVTPGDTDAADPKYDDYCLSMYITDDQENPVRTDLNDNADRLALKEGDRIKIGAEYRSPDPAVSDTPITFKNFRISRNLETPFIADIATQGYQPESEIKGDERAFYPETDYFTIDDSGSLTITIEAIAISGEGTEVLLQGVNNCAPRTVVVELDPEVEPPDDTQCIAEGEEGSAGELGGDVLNCCAGLAEVSCENYDEDAQQCTIVGDCKRCVQAGEVEEGQTPTNINGQCTTGENQCNAPEDCDEPVDPVDPPDPTTSCVALGQSGSTTAADIECCTGTVAVQCSTYNTTTSQCEAGTEACFTCVASNSDNVCGTGENQCNSPTDCPASTVTPPPVVTPPPPTSTAESSNFSVVVTTAQTCVERTSTNNTATYTITVTNGASTAQVISEIVASPAIGFSYVPGSAVVNGASDTSDANLAIENVGSSQKLTWSTVAGWTVQPSATFTITFITNVGSEALTGDALMEALVVPANVAVDSATLRAQATTRIAQSCTIPKTGLFDSTWTKIVAGLMIVIVSIAFYVSNTGDKFAVGLANSRAARKAELMSLKMTDPRKHFEESFKDKTENKRKKK